MVPEYSVSSLEKSLKFYKEILGFKVEYQRPEDKFAFLSLQGSQLMIEELRKGEGSQNTKSIWHTGKLEYPFGRGFHFQIELKSISPLLKSLRKNKYPIKAPPRDAWFRKGKILVGMRYFMVMDPDGYLFLFNQDLGRKPVSKNWKP
jgi:catechol 2,3-dioxygenase-like lactoylglutathione lyase family enzyme